MQRELEVRKKQLEHLQSSPNESQDPIKRFLRHFEQTKINGLSYEIHVLEKGLACLPIAKERNKPLTCFVRHYAKPYPGDKPILAHKMSAESIASLFKSTVGFETPAFMLTVNEKRSTGKGTTWCLYTSEPISLEEARLIVFLHQHGSVAINEQDYFQWDGKQLYRMKGRDET